MTPQKSPTVSPSRTRRLAFYAALLAIGGVLALLLGEILLRLIPIPGVVYHTFYYDSVTGNKYYPGATEIYRNVDGESVRRRVNSWGFLDVEHTVDAQPGTLRIGIFGDSYTQAAQVPIENTFFRLLEADLNGRPGALAGVRNTTGEAAERVEVLAFGVSGRSTLQSWLECQNWMEPLALDYLVYVFVDNDPGDQLREIKRTDIIPYAQLSGDTFVVDNSFHELYAHKSGRLHRTWQFLKARSLVMSTLQARVMLLREYGVKTRTTEADMDGAVGPRGRAGMAPSSWPSDSLVTQGWTLTGRIIDRWRHDVEAQGRRFVIVHVPRREQLEIPLERQDSWAPRLHAYCAAEGIDLVDPTPYLAPRQAAGETVIHDHFTRSGHRYFTDAITDYFVTHFKETP